MEMILYITTCIISSSIMYLLLFKVFKNPFKVIGNTVKKKIILFIVLLIIFVFLASTIDDLNLRYEKIYSGVIFGTYLALINRLMKTDLKENNEKY